MANRYDDVQRRIEVLAQIKTVQNRRDSILHRMRWRSRCERIQNERIRLMEGQQVELTFFSFSFLCRMLERDAGEYEAVATNEHGTARQRVRLEIAEYPRFIRRPDETFIMTRRNGRLEARVVGVPDPEIKWYKDWQPITESARIKVKKNPESFTKLNFNKKIFSNPLDLFIRSGYLRLIDQRRDHQRFRIVLVQCT